MVEGARLESVYTRNRIEGSNPSFTATEKDKYGSSRLFYFRNTKTSAQYLSYRLLIQKTQLATCKLTCFRQMSANFRFVTSNNLRLRFAHNSNSINQRFCVSLQQTPCVNFIFFGPLKSTK